MKFSLITIPFAMLAAGASYAVTPTRTPSLEDLNRYMRQAQLWATQVERSRTINDFSSFDAALDMYVDTALELHEQATAQAAEYNATRGRRGSLESLNALERTASRHVPEAERLTRKIGAIQAGVSTGRIAVSRAAQDQMSPEAAIEFREQMEPSILERYPSMTSPGTIGPQSTRSDTACPLTPESTNCTADDEDQDDLTADLCRSSLQLMDGLLSLVVPTAKAATAATCFSTCSASYGAACGACLLQGAATLADEYDRWKRCRRASFWKKLWCWTRFIVVIA